MPELDHAKHAGLGHALDEDDLLLKVLAEVVPGTAWEGASGSVNLDVGGGGRAFLREMTGNITDLTFSNIPDGTAESAMWLLALRIDATGGYSFASSETLVWRDGSTWGDLSLYAHALNILAFWRVGSTTLASLAWNGGAEYDPYVFNFKVDDSLSVPVVRSEVIDVENATVLGAGAVTYYRDATVITEATEFTAGTHAEFIVNAKAGQRVSVPRRAP